MQSCVRRELLQEKKKLLRPSSRTKSAAVVRLRREAARAEDYRVPDGVCVGLHVARRLFGRRACVDAHAREVLREAPFHVAAQRGFSQS